MAASKRLSLLNAIAANHVAAGGWNVPCMRIWEHYKCNFRQSCREKSFNDVNAKQINTLYVWFDMIYCISYHPEQGKLSSSYWELKKWNPCVMKVMTCQVKCKVIHPGNNSTFSRSRHYTTDWIHLDTLAKNAHPFHTCTLETSTLRWLLVSRYLSFRLDHRSIPGKNCVTQHNAAFWIRWLHSP